MRLIPWEEERLQVFAAAELARRHRAAGLRLNHPEAVALIADAMLEAARAGAEYAEVEAAGRSAVDPAEVMDGVRSLLDEVRVEVLLGDGARVVALTDPLERGEPPDPLGPGALVIGDAADVVVNEGREAIELEVRSESRRRVMDLLALPVRAREPAARLRSRGGARLPTRPAGRRVHGLGARRDEDGPARALRGHA